MDIKIISSFLKLYIFTYNNNYMALYEKFDLNIILKVTEDWNFSENILFKHLLTNESYALWLFGPKLKVTTIIRILH